MMQSKELLNLADMIQGEINRICVTDDVSELFSMAIHAEQNICKLCFMRYEDFKKRQEKLNCPSAEPEQIVRDIATIIENEKDMRVILKSTELEPAIPLSWIENHIEWLKSVDNMFSTLTAMQISTMVKKWRGEQDEQIR